MWNSDRTKTYLTAAGVAVVVYTGLLGLFGERAVPTAYAQDQFLSRRIDQVEQRFFSIESRISRIEQESRAISIAPRLPVNSNETELQFLRSQIETLRMRLGEAECGLLRVDERTLTPTSRQARIKSATGGTDKCRSEPASPVTLSARP